MNHSRTGTIRHGERLRPGGTAAAQGGAHLADPGAQQADAHLAVVVQVGVEAAAALRQVAEERRHGRVDVGQLDVEQEEPVLVGGPSRAFDQRRKQILGHSRGKTF